MKGASDDAEATLERRLDALVRQARVLGLGRREVVARVREAWDASTPKRSRTR